MARRTPASDRFWAKVAPADPGECWLWNGQRNWLGYGQFWDGSRTVGAHRWSYEFMRSEIPYGLSIDHLCSTPACVNPYHLDAVTKGANSRRMVERGRWSGPNPGLHPARHSGRYQPVYVREANRLADLIDVGQPSAGTVVRFLSCHGGSGGTERLAVDLLQSWGMVAILAPIERAYGRYVVLPAQGKGTFVAADPPIVAEG